MGWIGTPDDPARAPWVGVRRMRVLSSTAELEYALLDVKAPRPGAQGGTRTSEQPDEVARRIIRCGRCGAHVTDASQRIEVAGQHHHTFFNPAGMIYRVACFADAPGCSGVGGFSAEFSWFPDHRWQIAICRSCAEHLGWHFDGGSSFSALIVERIEQLDS